MCLKIRILSVTVIPPGDDAQWWRIHKLANGLDSNNCKVDVVHYIIKGGRAYSVIKSEPQLLCNAFFKIGSLFGLLLYH